MELVTFMDFIREYWWVIVIVVALVLAFILLRPRQRVSLTSDGAPVRPHMAYAKPPEGRGIVGEAAAATSDVTGQIFRAPVHSKLDGEGKQGDDLCLLKGVGPKFADALHALGFDRFEQIAALGPTEIDRLDNQLGAFRGRLTRDRIVEQADYLARNDIDGFEQKFGKLTG
jgi:predicted flap endonuclease-1-like 5' DNA nuclease